MTKFTEVKQSNDAGLVEILAGPAPVKDDAGATVGLAQVQRVAVTDYKTKAPTGDKLVYLVFTPMQGRAERIRLSHALGSLEALGLVPTEAPEEDAETPAP